MSSGPLHSPVVAGRRSMRRLATSILFLAGACSSGHPASPKITFDLTRLDAEGLTGGPGALRALHYEFCIPAGEPHAAEVRGVDATAQFMPRSRGRIGCTTEQVLVVGSTHQPGYRHVLERLAALSYVQRIEQAYFE
ncbi:MAG TPA: hypothetical protein VKF40_12915 [Burkholderiales bacterium]|nr:hypothetical protein [Burkholderiales bacterium]